MAAGPVAIGGTAVLGRMSGTRAQAEGNLMASVGERIRKRRTELGWTQDVLAQKAGISKSFLSDLENGKRNVGADTLYDIARA